MIKVTSKVLDRPPCYLNLLPYTVWDNEVDAVIREAKRQNSLTNMQEINKIAAVEEMKATQIYGAVFGRVFIPKAGVNPKQVKNKADALAVRYHGMWNQSCQIQMSQLATIKDYGLLSLRVVTTVGVNFIVDGFQGTKNISNLRYHGIGTGGTAEAIGDTALVTELTTQLSTASTRATGTLAEGASANIYRTVGANVVNTSVTVTEHGIFDQAATGGGSLLDRSLFAGIGLVNGNTLQTTYELTLAGGG